MNWNEQTVLITGGTRGIGRELARDLVRRGARVAICGRGAVSVEARAAGEPLAIPCDLASTEQLERLVEEVRSELGPVTMLINNAGVQCNHDWAETEAADRAEWGRLEVAVNLTAPLALTALLLEDLRAARPGYVVNVTSLLALAPKPSAPVYCATKSGLRAFTGALRDQLAASRTPVRLIEVVPPLVDTDMTAGRGSGKMAPADVAAAIVGGLEAGDDEVWIGRAKAIRWLHRLAPGLVRRILRRG